MYGVFFIFAQNIILLILNINMDKRRLSQWMLLAVVCLSFSIGESYAQKNDFGNLARYSKQNAALPKATKKDKRVIFMGNSITEGWVRTHPDFFKSNGYIGRGISGQTSYQFLLRFREDVINLSPALVVINAGTNDHRSHGGRLSDENFRRNRLHPDNRRPWVSAFPPSV